MVTFDIFSGYGDYNGYTWRLILVLRQELAKVRVRTDQNTFELKLDEKCKWNGLVKVKDIDWKNGVQ